MFSSPSRPTGPSWIASWVACPALDLPADWQLQFSSDAVRHRPPPAYSCLCRLAEKLSKICSKTAQARSDSKWSNKNPLGRSLSGVCAKNGHNLRINWLILR